LPFAAAANLASGRQWIVHGGVVWSWRWALDGESRRPQRSSMFDPLLRPLATVRDYPELHAALRARQEALGVSIETLSAVTGLSYAAKLLEPLPIIDASQR
jgi:hypothetical protein